MKTRAYIYCRVSSLRQVQEGHGLEGQEKRCKDYATAQGYQVLGVIKDEAVSGGITEREGMQSLLSCLNQYQNEKDESVVIIDDIKRLARDVQGHFTLKTAIYTRNARLESPSHRFESSPEGKFVETVLAGAAELERNQNKRQVINRMKSRLENGFWPFCMPHGLINKKDPIHGKILIPREPYATIYKEGIEKFRDGIIPTIDAFREFVNTKYKSYGIIHVMSDQTARKTLNEILYAGYIEYPKWDVPRIKGKHTGFITLETYLEVQNRFKSRAKPHRKDYSRDFPLRPYVLCDSCGIPMTGSFHTGRNKKHPHYFCRNRSCKFNNKNIPKVIFETKFSELLSRVKPSDELVNLTQDILLETWNNRLENDSLHKINITNEIKRITDELEEFLKRVGRTDNDTLIEVYEQKIKELVEKKRELEKQLQTNPYTNQKFGTALEKVFETIKNPIGMWQSDDYRDKKTILFMYFEEKLRYNYQDGFGTAGLAYPIKLINDLEQAKTTSVDISHESWNQIQDYVDRWYRHLQNTGNLASL